MQALEVRVEDAERKRVEAVARMAGMKHGGGTLPEVVHDARNMVTALALYCDLLSEPGVLAPQYVHYGHELRLIAAASRRLVERLMLLDGDEALSRSLYQGADSRRVERRGQAAAHALARRPNDPIDNLQEELAANQNLLAAMAGMAIALSVRIEGGARPVLLCGEDLTRVLVNLVKNAAEAMGRPGVVEIGLHEQADPASATPMLVLTVEDTGPGIVEELRERIFDAGFTTHAEGSEAAKNGGWPVIHRGMGLSISRSIVEAAGGRISAANRQQGGARFTIDLPVRAH